MSSEEKSAWVMLVVAACAYAIYLAIILERAANTPLADVPYVSTMLWTIGGAIVVNIVVNILAGIISPKSAGKKDQRDREIYRFGEYVGRAFVVIGGVAALVMAMLELPYFWIANAVYLAFVLSAILSSTARVIVYRRGLPAW
jgi:cell division protein FtsW (lipid II flippase)